LHNSHSTGFEFMGSTATGNVAGARHQRTAK